MDLNFSNPCHHMKWMNANEYQVQTAPFFFLFCSILFHFISFHSISFKSNGASMFS